MADDTARNRVSDHQACLLLTIDQPELIKLERAGWIKPETRNSWDLIKLVQGFARWAKWRATVSSTAELAACWNVTKQYVGQLAGDGWFKPLDGKRGFYNRDEADAGYVRFLKDDGRRATKSAADSRVRDARATEIEQRTAERARKLIAIDEVEAAFATVMGLIRTELGGHPARVTRDLTLRREIEKDLDESLGRVCARVAAEIAALETGVASPRALPTLNS